ncbi:MAG: hypothetical protein LUC50_06305, partial [Ruminococcus sp.]|nr:hypothetical protein [Ruminococcus sp.]
WVYLYYTILSNFWGAVHLTGSVYFFVAFPHCTRFQPNFPDPNPSLLKDQTNIEKHPNLLEIAEKTALFPDSLSLFSDQM